ncbi:hypothetical protein [Mucilaginibacter aquatilis]|uniref:VCBS repeat-containing protein n=1 Tax=Mucilaginibacter aquatilis TaxID=1517760 RepID=A0A6I4I9P9_9SPHI|nr:hypothetical protein [Mucilaginibacter aquatilis]MVN91782.1 hypothetical protein [Mucilaginibacter aquatilis]
MRLQISLSLLMLASGLQVIAQTPKLSVNVPANMKQFVTKGYEVLDITKGDLNRDAYTDAVMVLYKKGEEKTSNVIDNPEKRPLLILLGQANKTYKIANRSDNAVYCVDCGGQMGDPFTGITIKNGYFSVEHYGGSGQRWTRIITFKYNPAAKNWLLHKDGHEYFRATEPEKVESKIETVKNFGKVPFEKFNIYKER